MSHDGVVAQPPVTDHRAIIDVVRRHGSVHYPPSAVPGEFILWRRQVRQVARLAGIRISVTRGVDFVLVENCDYEVSEEDSLATTDVIGAHILGRDLSFDDAVYARRRTRLQLAPPLEKETDGERDSYPASRVSPIRVKLRPRMRSRSCQSFVSGSCAARRDIR
jgi:hypothetical protein